MTIPTASSLTAAQKRCLRGLAKKPATKMTKTLQSLFEMGLVSIHEVDGKLVSIRRTPEGVHLSMELARQERMLYTIDSTGRKTRRKWS